MLLVVLGHAVSDTLMGNRAVKVPVLLFDFIYSFHMPLFFFLAGFVSAKIMDMKTVKEKERYIIARFVRLMVPYTVVGILYIPLKFMLSTEVRTSIQENNLLFDFLTGTNPNFQLWTLYTLFICALLLCLFNQVGVRLLLILAFSLKVIDWFWICPIKIIHYVMNDALFFTLGIAANKTELKTAAFKTVKFKTGISFIALIVLNVINHYIKSGFLELITALAGILTVCEISMLLQRVHTPALDVMGAYSMDIYIMANLVQVTVRSLFLYRMGMPGALCCLFSTILGICFPVIISKYVIRKIKITRMLILGDFSRE